MLYYQLRNGKIVDQYDVYKAYEIATGNAFDYFSADFSKWLYSMLGESIVKAMKETEVDLMQFIKGNNIIAAVRLYREIHGCSLREAKDAVDAIRAEMEVQAK